jgi:hypothetical protein
MNDDYGWKFWVKVALLFIAGSIGVFVIAWIFLSITYAWSFGGALLLLAVVALTFGWFHDRKTQSHGEGGY